ncbi:UDP-glucuronosyltransferase 2A1 [Branchiostoma belcheri]|nr:UDP-glucuronosyltransferase 2A1 [Branchiostoma belcheri]
MSIIRWQGSIHWPEGCPLPTEANGHSPGQWILPRHCMICLETLFLTTVRHPARSLASVPGCRAKMKGTLTLILLLFALLALMLGDADAQNNGDGGRPCPPFCRRLSVHGDDDTAEREARDLTGDAPQVNNEAEEWAEHDRIHAQNHGLTPGALLHHRLPSMRPGLSPATGDEATLNVPLNLSRGRPRETREEAKMKGTLTLMLLLVALVALMLDGADAQDGGGDRGRIAGVRGDAAAEREPRDLAADVPQVENEAEERGGNGLRRAYQQHFRFNEESCTCASQQMCGYVEVSCLVGTHGKEVNLLALKGSDMGIASKLRCSAILLVFLCFLIENRSDAERVLLVPPPLGDSHWITLAKIGRALLDRGHVVTVVVSEGMAAKQRAEWPDFQFETFQDRGTHARLKALQDNAFSAAGKLSRHEERGVFFAMFGELREHCALLLGDRTLLARLRASPYSVVISDPIFPCGAILSAHIDFRVPHISVMRYRCAAPSVVRAILATDFTDDMTFVQRLQNAVWYTVVPVIARRDASRLYDELVRAYVGGEETIQSVTSRTDLWFYQTDYLLQDFPRPTMPNMVQDMEAFVQRSGDDGVIVVSFGSMVKTMPEDKKEIFATAFARLRQKVLWRYVGEKPAGLGNNTKPLAWLPQNDLLAHPKTRAFITHAGSNGLYEALHHGVPVVCLPLFGDQPANAARVVARGLGVTLDFSTVTADQLYQAILDVLTNNSYRETGARLSRLHRDQPQSPMERAVWWIEHVIKHGRLPHLRARAVELPWYQYYLLDVAAFLLSVCSAVLGTVWCGCSLVCRKCCATEGGGKLKSQ